VKDELQRVVNEQLDGVDMDLVEMRHGGTKNRPVLEVRVDRRDGANVTVDDCARASRAIEARLDGSDLVSPRYVLQVSSPGDRPLRNAAEWRRFVGRWANVLSPALDGRLEGKIVAVDGEEGSEQVVLQPARGPERRVALADVKEARLAFHI
jgi:ribosome maturation factor RimP